MIIGAGAGAGAAEQFYSEPEPEPEPECFPGAGAGAGADQKCHGSASLLKTVCYNYLTPFRRATFKVKLRKVELPATAARAVNW